MNLLIPMARTRPPSWRRSSARHESPGLHRLEREVEVEHIEAELMKACIEGTQRRVVALVIVPELRHDENDSVAV